MPDLPAAIEAELVDLAGHGSQLADLSGTLSAYGAAELLLTLANVNADLAALVERLAATADVESTGGDGPPTPEKGGARASGEVEATITPTAPGEAPAWRRRCL